MDKGTLVINGISYSGGGGGGSADNKMDSENPVGTGTLSINRRDGSTIGDKSVAVGDNTVAAEIAAFAEGQDSVAANIASHAEGSGTQALGWHAHSEGSLCIAQGNDSHAENEGTYAIGNGSHAEGGGTHADGHNSHAEGAFTKATGDQSHTEGSTTEAKSYCSHAEGEGTLASSRYQHVQGKYNVEDTADKYADIVGNGTGVTRRSNAYTLDWEGNAVFAGSVKSKGLTLGNDVKISTSAAAEHSGIIRFGIDEEGNYGYYKPGADTVTPFKTGGGTGGGLDDDPNNQTLWAYENGEWVDYSSQEPGHYSLVFVPDFSNGGYQSFNMDRNDILIRTNTIDDDNWEWTYEYIWNEEAIGRNPDGSFTRLFQSDPQEMHTVFAYDVSSGWTSTDILDFHDIFSCSSYIETYLAAEGHYIFVNSYTDYCEGYSFEDMITDINNNLSDYHCFSSDDSSGMIWYVYDHNSDADEIMLFVRDTIGTTTYIDYVTNDCGEDYVINEIKDAGYACFRYDDYENMTRYAMDGYPEQVFDVLYYDYNYICFDTYDYTGMLDYVYDSDFDALIEYVEDLGLYVFSSTDDMITYLEDNEGKKVFDAYSYSDMVDYAIENDGYYSVIDYALSNIDEDSKESVNPLVASYLESNGYTVIKNEE